MKIDLTGRRALVAGASRGIGLAIARSFAAAGADVAICARQAAPLESAAAALKALGHRVSARACDLSNAAKVRVWVEAAAQDLGGIDILVNNASAFGRSDDEAGWAASVQVDLLAPVRACHAALARKRIRVNCIAPGSIFFKGGLWDTNRQQNPALYEATLSSIPSGRFGTPEEVGQVATFLVSDQASWVTGQIVAVDGGQSL